MLWMNTFVMDNSFDIRKADVHDFDICAFFSLGNAQTFPLEILVFCFWEDPNIITIHCFFRKVGLLNSLA